MAKSIVNNDAAYRARPSITADDLNPGRYVASLGFTLPPGCYGTMALRQLAHFLACGEVGLSADPVKDLALT